MKQRIHSKGKGWYIFCTNYRDKEDCCYLNLFFPENSEPIFIPNEEGKCRKMIDVLEAKYTSYKGKVGMTIFKYVEVDDVPQEDNSMFGGSRQDLGDNLIQDDDLAFY